MTTEHPQERIEKKSEKTSEELLNLKKELAEEVADKLQEKEFDLLSYIENPLNLLKKHILKKWISDYLVDEKTLADKAHDELLWNIWEWIITTNIEKYREMFREATTEDDLERLRADTQYQEISTNTPSQTEPENSLRANQTTNNSNKNTEKAKVSSSKSYEIDHFNITVSPETKKIRDSLKWKNKPDLEPFACSFKIYNTLKAQGKIKNTKYLTSVDFTKKRREKRFFVINMENYTVEHAVKVWHWKKSWNERAKQFSNKVWSNQSSLWGYLLPDKITKSPNKSRSWLRCITWLESTNNNAKKRWVAVHQWWENGSEWCFTLPKDISRKVMEKIKWSFLFAYAKSKKYFAQSNYFQQNSDGSIAA